MNGQPGGLMRNSDWLEALDGGQALPPRPAEHGPQYLLRCHRLALDFGAKAVRTAMAPYAPRPRRPEPLRLLPGGRPGPDRTRD